MIIWSGGGVDYARMWQGGFPASTTALFRLYSASAYGLGAPFLRALLGMGDGFLSVVLDVMRARALVSSTT